MLAITVELLHGGLRAGSPDDLVIAGDDPGEWPPSPARVLSALVAADGTRARCRVTDGSELLELERAAPPVIYADSRADLAVSPQRKRFVIEDRRAENSVQEYPARSAAGVAFAPRLAPRTPYVVYAWENLDPDPALVAALRARAARVAYLGCSDLPARVTVEGFLPERRPAAAWVPDETGRHLLPVPFEGLVAVLDMAFDDWSASGERSVRRSQYRVERARYRGPGELDEPIPGWPHVAWLRFDRALPGRTVLSITQALKAAVLDLYQRHLGEVPDLLHGHTRAQRGYQLAQWLALPDVGHAHADGDLHGAAVMLPQGTSPEVVAGVRICLGELSRNGLHVPGRPLPLGIRLFGGERRPWAAHPLRWSSPRRMWVSALPVVHERWRHGGPSLADVAEWCRHAGYPEPEAAACRRLPMLQGAVQLRPEEVFRDRSGARRPYSHVRIDFARPVRGPVVLGRARQFGLGLMAPVGDG